jgi:hypothetical protein
MGSDRIPRRPPASETPSGNLLNRRSLLKSIFAMAALHGHGEVSIARNYGLKPSEVFTAVVEEAQTEIEEARLDGYRQGARSVLPRFRRTA